ncbi:MAG: DUF3667 domain-containing protein [Gemmatimonadaceae bacterium]
MRKDRMPEERRTVALRGAPAEYAPADYAPPAGLASDPCLNCGTNVQRHYCPECGQRAIDPDPTLHEFMHEVAQEFLNWDGKLFTTFRLLLTRPGALTQEYLTGRRSSFISPLRLYLTCSVLYFFLKALAPPSPMIIRTVSTSQAGVVTVKAGDESESLALLDRMAASEQGFKRSFGAHMGRALRHKAELQAAMTTAVPRMMFVLVPLFAALVALLFRRRHMRYPQHLAFTLHVHALFFLALILAVVPRITTSGALSAICVLASFACIASYLVLAMRRVYAVSLAGAAWRSALLVVTYFAASTVALLLTFAVILLTSF